MIRGGPNEGRSEMGCSCLTLLEGSRRLVDERLSSRPSSPAHTVPVRPLLSLCDKLSKIDDGSVVCWKTSIPGPWMRSFGGRQYEWQAGRRRQVV